MMLKEFRHNQKGSVLVMVVIIMGVILTMIPMITTYYANLHRQSHNYLVAHENLRIGTELGYLVAQAYEYGEQLNNNGTTCTSGWNLAYGSSGHFLCFQGQSTTCINTDNTGYSICLVLTGTPTILGQTDTKPGKIALVAEWRRNKSNIFDYLFPEAEAAPGTDPYMPPDPTGSNTVTALTCTGGGSDPTICRSCGVSQNYICFLMQYCPADTPACGTAYTTMGIMVARSTASTANSQTFLASGSFIVPAYSALTVSVWGGGGGGGATCPTGGNGTAGGSSIFGAPTAVTAGGGGGGGASFNVVGTAGTAGTSSGDTYDFAGNAGNSTSNASGGGGGASYTGAGGDPGTDGYVSGSAGSVPGGGGGGGGGWAYLIYGGAGGGGGALAIQKYTSGQLTVGSSITITVGSGGAGGSCNSNGGAGGAGEVSINWY